MDAFSSDSVPVHLITTDALAVYRRALRPDGLLLINVSNRYLDLAPIAGTVGMACGFSRVHTISRRVGERSGIAGLVPSTWVALATRTPTSWRPWPRNPAGVRSIAATGPAWTDDFADVFGAIMWRR